jgi:hypothetical protein
MKMIILSGPDLLQLVKNDDETNGQLNINVRSIFSALAFRDLILANDHS